MYMLGERRRKVDYDSSLSSTTSSLCCVHLKKRTYIYQHPTHTSSTQAVKMARPGAVRNRTRPGLIVSVSTETRTRRERLIASGSPKSILLHISTYLIAISTFMHLSLCICQNVVGLPTRRCVGRDQHVSVCTVCSTTCTAIAIHQCLKAG